MESAAVRKGHWVTRYAIGITILGVLIMLGGAVNGGWTFYTLYRIDELPLSVLWGHLLVGAKVCLTGLLAIALAQLLVYTLGSSLKPGWILRKTSWVLFLMAGLSVFTPVLGIWQIRETLSRTPILANMSWFNEWIVLVSWPMLYGISGSLLFIALALTLRRVLSVIEESKSVV